MTNAFTRTTSRTVTFAHPFALSGVDGVQPAGSYIVETDEELIDSLSFPVYRRSATWLRLPQSNRGMAMEQTVLIDPDELGRLLEPAENGNPLPG
ncbi:hypothetical protein ABNQ38_04180 [Azospirillum sp. A29]|uniref:hypothetical protein n=1 Tax=Azospirillum sp. A29 TaxID=3160606 RepID=UPI00366AEF92